MRLAEGTMAWPRASKNEVKARRNSFAVMGFMV
jgi:hypothetical protein